MIRVTRGSPSSRVWGITRLHLAGAVLPAWDFLLLFDFDPITAQPIVPVVACDAIAIRAGVLLLAWQNRHLDNRLLADLYDAGMNSRRRQGGVIRIDARAPDGAGVLTGDLDEEGLAVLSAEPDPGARVGHDTWLRSYTAGTPAFHRLNLETALPGPKVGGRDTITP